MVAEAWSNVERPGGTAGGALGSLERLMLKDLPARIVGSNPNAGPGRREVMDRKTVDQVLHFLDVSPVRTLDITGGAPELNPHFRYLVEQAYSRGLRIIDRCNLPILEEPDQSDLGEFLARHGVEIVASLPCYLEENVDAQRDDS